MTPRAEDPHIGLIVEGKADAEAVPLLLRRYLHERGYHRDILGKPFLLHGKGNATKRDGIEGYVRTAACRPGCKGILVVLDADDECIRQASAELRERLAGKVGQPVVIAYADRKYEDWLHASIETLDLGAIDYAEGRNGERIITSALKARKESYSKPLLQPRLTKLVDIGRARRRSASLSRLFYRLDTLLSELDGG